MKDFLLVLKVLLKQRVRSMFEGGNKRRSAGLPRPQRVAAELAVGAAKSAGGGIGLKIFLGACFLFLFAMVSLMSWFTLEAMHAAGQLASGLFVFFAAAMALTLVFCLADIVGSLFAAKDAEILMALPLKQSSVFMARFANIYLGELVIAAFIALPSVVSAAILGGAANAVWTILFGLIVLLLLPILPLALGTLVSLLLMRWSAFMRHRDTIMTVLGVVLTLVISIGAQFLSPGASGTNAFFDASPLAAAGEAFPPAMWAAEFAAMTGGPLSSLASGGLFVGLCAAAMALCGFVGAKTYFKGAGAASESAKASGKKAKLDSKELRQKSAVWACYGREWRSVMRSTTYAMNCLLGVVMFPLMLAVTPLITMSRGGDAIGLPADVSAFHMFDYFAEGAPGGLVFAIAFMVLMFTTFANMAASTAISREGEVFAQLKAMPLKMRDLVYGKLIFGAGSNVLTVLLSGVVACAMFPSFLLEMLLATAAASIASVATAALGLLIDVLRPKLVWQSEAEAVKQNLNGVFGMLLSLGAAVLLGAPALLLGLVADLWPSVAAAAVLSAGAGAVSVWGVGRKAGKRL